MSNPQTTARGMSEFGQMHFNWMRGVENMGIDPLHLKLVPPVEMTLEEHNAIANSLSSEVRPLGTIMKTLFGHPVVISAEPVSTIPLPSRA